MFKKTILTALLLTLYLPLSAEQRGDDSVVSKDRIRALLSAFEFKRERLELVGLGVSAFPIYEQLLNHPQVTVNEVVRIFGVIGEVKADRRGFVEHVIKRLTSPNGNVRRSAVQLLGQIGSYRDASPLVALLWDEERTVVYAVAQTLSLIGSERELTALDIWIKSGNHRADAELRRFVQQFRDALQRKIEEDKRKISS